MFHGTRDLFNHLNFIGMPASTGGFGAFASFAGCPLNLLGKLRPSQSLKGKDF